MIQRALQQPETQRATSHTARALLDRHFETAELAALLGTRDATSLSLARAATWAPLADVLSRPGKGVRARLVERAHAIGREAALGKGQPLPPALAQLLELLHAGSLIIDDIEDGALTRRGAPALHRVIGTPLAINAGNFLYFLPLLALDELGFDDTTALAMHRQITRSLLRCHHGQALDLSLRVCDLSREQLTAAVELSTCLKTGALMELACALGALAAHAPPSVAQALTRFGCEAGIALQMLDDLSGFINPARREKALEDLVALRPTWAWVLAAEQVDDATLLQWQRLATTINDDSSAAPLLLEQIAARICSLREVPRVRIARALDELRNSVGDLPSLSSLALDLRELEHGYV